MSHSLQGKYQVLLSIRLLGTPLRNSYWFSTWLLKASTDCRLRIKFYICRVIYFYFREFLFSRPFVTTIMVKDADNIFAGFKRIDLPPNIAQTFQGLTARELDTEDGGRGGCWGCADVKGTQGLAEKNRLLVLRGQIPRAGARIPYKDKEEVQKSRIQDKLKRGRGSHLKAEPGDLKPTEDIKSSSLSSSSGEDDK